jgi:hypothetical protein
MPTRYDLRGKLKRDALRCAFEALVRRHTALRTRFVKERGAVYGQLLPTSDDVTVASSSSSSTTTTTANAGATTTASTTSTTTTNSTTTTTTTTTATTTTTTSTAAAVAIAKTSSTTARANAVAPANDVEAWLHAAWREVELSELTSTGSESSSGGEDDADGSANIAARLVALEQLATSDASAPFLLSAGPPIRATLVRVRADWHVLLLTLHHIAGDGASFGVIERDLRLLYEAALSADQALLDTRVARRAERRRVARAALAPPPLRYVDYAHWQRSAVAPLLVDQLAYWRATLADDLSPIELPCDGAHPPKASFGAAAIDIVIDAPLADQLRALSSKHGTTLYV